jgi:hypothetical protein
MNNQKDLCVKINKAVKEINAIKNLFNKDPNCVFRLKDIITEISVKYDIGFNTLDRILNWAVRDNMDLSKFKHLPKENKNFDKIVKQLNKQFKTILNINGKLYIPKSTTM